MRFRQDAAEFQTFICHLREDVVGGAVQDAHDGEDSVGHQALFQSLDHRNSAADTGLEANLHPLLGRCGKDVASFLGQQGLVGGHHVLAGSNSLHHKGFGRFNAADQFDDDIDIRIIDQLHSVLS